MRLRCLWRVQHALPQLTERLLREDERGANHEVEDIN